MKKAFITGVSGQDGSYLSEFLLNKNYKVFGMVRRSSNITTGRIDHLMNNKNFKLFYGDVTDSSNINQLLKKIKPDEIYNLAAQSHVKVSFELPDFTAQVDALGTIRILSAIQSHCRYAKFYQASTSEIFGGLKQTLPQNEKTLFEPKSPYGAAKLYAYWMVRIYREAYGLYASNGILFNHESPRRGKTFVTKKIIDAVVKIYKRQKKFLEIGNLDAVRDWGYAKEYVEAMWLVLQEKVADDYVIATNKSYTVRKFIELAFIELGMKIIWKGKGLKEIGYDKKSGRVLVKVNKKYFRPLEVSFLRGDFSKAKKKLGWKPKVNIKALVKIMIHDELGSY
jgi:GDPmannose 4,6-dehydratase